MRLKSVLSVRSTVLIALLLSPAFAGMQAPSEFDVKQLPGATGGVDLTVTNNRAVLLTGLTVKFVEHVTATSKDEGGHFIYDSIFNGDTQPALKQGESYTWHMLPNPSHFRPPDYTVDAVIFADGLAVGDPAAIRSLWKRREYAAIGLQQVFQDLDSFVPDVENTEDAISTLKRLEEQRLPPGTSREQRGAFMNEYGTVIEGLKQVADRRTRGSHESATARMVALRTWAARRIADIRNQVRPAQITETLLPLPAIH